MAGLILWALALTENKILRQLDEVISDKRFAVGNDLVFIPNFQQSFTPEFKAKVYTANETAYCDRFDGHILRYASTWAAKEAVYKAVKQLDTATLGWKKIEITREKIAGKPTVFIHNHKGNFNISLSISHDGDYVWAIAFAERI
jgi:holo-[acyl-carrier protein] synthase